MCFMSDKYIELFRNREPIQAYNTYDAISMLQIKMFTIAMFTSHYTLTTEKH